MIPAFILPLFLNRFVIGGLVGLGLLTGAYFKGYWDARSACQDNALKAEIAAMQRDMAAWQAADRVETMLQADMQAERNHLERKVQDYERELANRPVDSRCIINQRDVDGLRLHRKR